MAHLPLPHKHTHSENTGSLPASLLLSPWSWSHIEDKLVVDRKLIGKRMSKNLPILGSFSAFLLIHFPTPAMPRLETLGAPFCQEFGTDWWSSCDIRDGSPGTEGFW